MLESLPKVTLLGNAKSGLDVGLLTTKQVLFIIQIQRPKQEVAFAGPSLVYCEVQSFTHSAPKADAPCVGRHWGLHWGPVGLYTVGAYWAFAELKWNLSADVASPLWQSLYWRGHPPSMHCYGSLRLRKIISIPGLARPEKEPLAGGKGCLVQPLERWATSGWESPIQ